MLCVRVLEGTQATVRICRRDGRGEILCMSLDSLALHAAERNGVLQIKLPGGLMMEVRANARRIGPVRRFLLLLLGIQVL